MKQNRKQNIKEEVSDQKRLQTSGAESGLYC